MMRKYLKNIFVYVFLPVLGGAVYYYLFCPDILFVKFFDDFFGKGIHLQLYFPNVFVRLIRNYFMDFIWAFSFMAFILLTFEKDFKQGLLIIIVFVAEVFLESAQRSAYVTGTYDICDIFVEISANIIVIFLLSRREKKNEKN